ncbi:ArsR family transcriptional regulator protein [Marine Group I thaumarchaeote SCGC AAA799-B03]|uniref:ArsR family transcriptional regulator protein n=3 Tax=Marine Group I TaxID=905826 RepID=A0A087S7Q3_9ARCH|nr:ArsR family transcriptional regulator protein [Marine Group I thaumarchaeote SCGC AAA799-D11]KFM18846.1 ArsR family transcriptional regulator protein [Marine Group I thaumarchaeote SCGC RSA3]KFM21757.1 ArsR family transcriptional regulator protein [Marine Group I thaumarchaeote SCGC AAA799-B03]
MSAENPDDGLTEKIKILATDDEKIKSFGELFTNDSSREILQLLFNEEMTANQIAQKTDISLQLVKYHLNKLQDLGVVKITKVEKNSKSQDMKVYSATKFSIVIVPPKLSEKTKESKLLVRSFRHIYKVAGLGIATGVSGILSLSQFQSKPIPVENTRQFAAIEESKRMESFDESAESMIASTPVAESEPQDLSAGMEITEKTIDSGVSGIDLSIPFVIITIILGGLTLYYFLKSRKSS